MKCIASIIFFVGASVQLIFFRARHWFCDESSSCLVYGLFESGISCLDDLKASMVVVVDNGSDLVILLDATEYSDFF